MVGLLDLSLVSRRRGRMRRRGECPDGEIRRSRPHTSDGLRQLSAWVHRRSERDASTGPVAHSRKSLILDDKDSGRLHETSRSKTTLRRETRLPALMWERVERCRLPQRKDVRKNGTRRAFGLSSRTVTAVVPN